MAGMTLNNLGPNVREITFGEGRLVNRTWQRCEVQMSGYFACQGDKIFAFRGGGDEKSPWTSRVGMPNGSECS